MNPAILTPLANRAQLASQIEYASFVRQARLRREETCIIVFPVNAMIPEPPARQTLRWWPLLAALVALVAGCGQVITKPTAPPPTGTPTVVVVATATVTTQPTPTPAPYTPEPSPTPTLTPTPVVHRIQSGETLIAIAGQYGVSVQAIQEANGIVDPRLLRVGQQLIIPTDEEDRLDAGTPTPAPTPLPLETGGLFFGNSADGRLWALGEVANPNDVPLEGVRLRLTLAGANDEAVAGEETLIQMDVLQPQARAPFGIFFSDPPPDFSSYFLETLQAFPAYLGGYYLDLEILDLEEEDQRYYSHSLQGVVRNTGPEDAVEVHVTITLYDAQDRVIGFRRVEPAHNVIPRGGETTFATEIIPLGGPVVHSSVVAQGRRRPTPTP